ncbi:GNAT family N-acetyltransferase [Deinococcus sp. RM]|uniref:GNAT family N-acetyltransferase n=1 Tax=Deinococcus sp. RM TaxID=2316359 RepID=UPI003AB5DE68
MNDPIRQLARAEAAAHGRGGTRAQFGPLVAAHHGPGLPLNSAWHDGSAPLVEADLLAFETFSAAHDMPTTLHLLAPSVNDALPLLTARGYTLTYVLHAYTHDLRDLPPAPTLAVRCSDDPDGWAALSAQGFGPGSEAVMRVVAHLPDTGLYQAHVDGQPAGTAALSLTEGVAALFGTSTLPGRRGLGAQTALLAARLHAAHAQGAGLASVFATPGSASERNIRRAGFRLTTLRLTFTRTG